MPIAQSRSYMPWELFQCHSFNLDCKKMVAYMFMWHCVMQRERVFQDYMHPLEEYKKVPVPLAVHIWLAQEVWHDTEFPLQRKGSLIPILQVCLALCFYATGCFQNVVGELIGVALSTACHTITRVTDTSKPITQSRSFTPWELSQVSLDALMALTFESKDQINKSMNLSTRRITTW